MIAVGSNPQYPANDMDSGSFWMCKISEVVPSSGRVEKSKT